jgi:hypothetical protein
MGDSSLMFRKEKKMGNKYVEHKGKDVPKSNVPVELLAERRLDMIHNYMQFWVEVLEKELGMEKVKELAIKWGKQQGIHTAKVYTKWFKKRGVDPGNVNLVDFCRDSARSSEIMGETYKAWVYDGGNKTVFQTLVCPTGKMFVELGLGADTCVKQCDLWMEESMRIYPKIGFKRTRGIDKDAFCEWENWSK